MHHITNMKADSANGMVVEDMLCPFSNEPPLKSIVCSYNDKTYVDQTCPVCVLMTYKVA